MLSFRDLEKYKIEGFIIKKDKPFVFSLKNDINMHIEIEDSMYFIWFDDTNKNEQKNPEEIKIYNSESELVTPFRNLQTYTLNHYGEYIIYFNEDPIIKLETKMYLTIPAQVEHKVKIIKTK